MQKINQKGNLHSWLYSLALPMVEDSYFTPISEIVFQIERFYQMRLSHLHGQGIYLDFEKIVEKIIQKRAKTDYQGIDPFEIQSYVYWPDDFDDFQSIYDTYVKDKDPSELYLIDQELNVFGLAHYLTLRKQHVPFVRPDCKRYSETYNFFIEGGRSTLRYDNALEIASKDKSSAIANDPNWYKIIETVALAQRPFVSDATGFVFGRGKQKKIDLLKKYARAMFPLEVLFEFKNEAN